MVLRRLAALEQEASLGGFQRNAFRCEWVDPAATGEPQVEARKPVGCGSTRLMPFSTPMPGQDAVE